MKSKIIFITSIVAAFICGLWIGQFQMLSTLRQNNMDFRFNHFAGETYIYTTVLNALREGHTNDGTKLLEQSLDESLFDAGQMPEMKRSGFIVQRDFRTARDYRRKYPWHSANPKIDKSVQQVLDSVK